MIYLEIGGAIFWTTIAAAVIWLATSLLALPQLRLRILRADRHSVARLAASLAGASVLRDIAAAAVLAGIMVLGGSIILRSYLENLQPTDEGIQAVIAIRDQIEESLDYAGNISTGLWIFAIGALGFVWLMLARSASRRRWMSAIEARKSALLTALSEKGTDALREELEQVAAGANSQFDGRIEQLIKVNEARFEEAEIRPAIELGGQRVSLRDLRSFEYQLGIELALSLPGEDAEHKEKREAADKVKALLEQIERQIPVELMTIAGGKRTYMLAYARAAIAPGEAEIDAELREQIADIRLRSHQNDAYSKARREPELLREWIGAGATSELAVTGTSYVGRLSGSVAIIALLLGFVGLNSINHGPAVLEGLRAVELELTINQGQNAIASAARAQPKQQPEESQLASNEATASYLRHSFRIALAQNLRQSLGTAGLAGEAGQRQIFAMSATEARREILVLSARPAGATLDPGLETPRIEARIPGEDMRPYGRTANALDLALNRQIARLQAEEGLWRLLRASAQQPAGRDYVADRFLATLFGSERYSVSHAMHVWSERVTGQFAAHIAAGGNPEAFVPSRSAQLSGDALFGTLRDRRIVADFIADAPQRFERRFADLHQGDPGSLHRVAPRLADTHLTAAIRPAYRGGASVYDTLFPAGSSEGIPPETPPAGGGGGGSGGGGGGGGGGSESARGNSAKPVRTASRSYSRVRMSGRVGGVVIGREPDNQGASLDIIGFDWTVNAGSRLVFTLTARNGKSVTVGPIHPAIAHHALAYAADGRVVVSTLPLPTTQSGNELNIPVRRVAVHPAFEDTAFACPAIQVDRFVDTFTNRDSTDERIKRINQSREAVTLLGAVLNEIATVNRWRQMSAEQQILSLLNEEGQRQVQREVRLATPEQRAEYFRQLTVTPEVAEAINQINSSIEEIQRQLERLLAQMKPISDLVKSCGMDEGCFPLKEIERLGLRFAGVDGFLTCLGGESDLAKCSDRVRAISATGSFLVDSGVREAPFILDDSFNFLTGASDATPYWPLDFIIQAVPQSSDGQDLQIEATAEPWVFPLVAGDIRTVVAEGIAADANAKTVLDAMRQFVITQRLFRLALDGRLGADFPLGQLIKIQGETRNAVRVQRHERWNPNQNFFEILDYAQGEFSKDLETISADASVADQCKAAVKAALDRHRSAPWPRSAGLWPFLGDFERHCAAYQAPSGMIKRRDDLRQLELIAEAIYIAQRGPETQPFQCEPL